MSWLSRLKNGLSKTASLFSFQRVDAAGLEEIEDALLCADVGYKTTHDILKEIKSKRPQEGSSLYDIVHAELVKRLAPAVHELEIQKEHKPFVILMIGVNGAGKTTTIGKLGQVYQKKGYQVSFVAADTFRAGATEQLMRWGERLHCRVHTSHQGADAAGMVFDALQKSQDEQDDIVFIDTAGRLQNRSDLMDELKKMTRVIRKKDPTAPHAVLLVLDATVGQNAISQVKAFQEMIGVTGLIMTKLDGTAKGGILVALAEQFNLPIHAIGIGEQIDDLQPFTASEYVTSLLGEKK